MCLVKAPEIPTPARALTPDDMEVSARARLEQSLRRRRAGAGSDILTSPRGLPTGGAVAKIGQAGQ
ncbi:MAG: hypothetical protein AAFY65_01320 [Pseudomonadota bacterium]